MDADTPTGIALAFACLLREADADYLRSRTALWDAWGVGDMVREELRVRALVEEHPLGCGCGACPD